MLIAASKLWLAVAALTLVTQVLKAGDWQHLLWVTMLPTLGLLATSGSMLVAGKARAAAVALLLIALMPLGILSANGGLDDYEVTAVDDIPAAMQEVISYGFTGTVPASMTVRADSQAAREGRELGSPSRDVTVPMGGIYFGSLALIILGVIVIVSKAIPVGFARRAWLRISPFASLAFVFLSGGLRKTEMPVWRNDPWLVDALGPLAAGGVAALAIIMVFADTAKSLQRPTSSLAGPPAMPPSGPRGVVSP